MFLGGARTAWNRFPEQPDLAGLVVNTIVESFKIGWIAKDLEQVQDGTIITRSGSCNPESINQIRASALEELPPPGVTPAPVCVLADRVPGAMSNT